MKAHPSMAFLAGRMLGSKSGPTVELFQKGRVGSQAWRLGDGETGPALDVVKNDVGLGPAFAIDRRAWFGPVEP